MSSRKDNVIIDVNDIEELPDGNKYKFEIKIPTSVGWIDNVHITIEDDGITRDVPMMFIDNKDGYALFETTIDLDTKALYRFYFKYNTNGHEYFVTNKDTKENIEYDEKNKLSVNFNVPDWAKGAIMYHIFVDRFKRGSKFAMEEMDRREIHKSWDEDVVLGDNPRVKHYSNDEQVWNVDFFGGDLKGI